MRVFILCAGKAERYGGVSKQLLTITRDGKCVLDRMIHQLKKRGIHDIWIVTHNKEIEKYANDNGINILYPELYDITPHTALSTRPMWTLHNLILLGDCVFSDETMDKIVLTRKNICFFGDIYDIWAVSFTDNNTAQFAFDVPVMSREKGIYYQKVRQSFRYLSGLDCSSPPSREQLEKSTIFYNIDDPMTFDLDTRWEYDCAKKEYIDTGMLDF